MTSHLNYLQLKQLFLIIMTFWYYTNTEGLAWLLLICTHTSCSQVVMLEAINNYEYWTSWLFQFFERLRRLCRLFTVIFLQYFLHREARKRNQFSFVCIYLILDRNWWIFSHTLGPRKVDLYIGWQWRNLVPYLCQLVFGAILWVKLWEMFATVILIK